MKSLFIAMAMMPVIALTGCNEGTPGGPGTTGEPPIFGQANDTFTLTTPMMSTSVRQGDEVEATIGIERVGRFKRDVVLNFSDLPKGVTVEPASSTIKLGAKDAKIIFKADSDTPLGDYQVKVSGHPPLGADAQNVFKLSVVKG